VTECSEVKQFGCSAVYIPSVMKTIHNVDYWVIPNLQYNFMSEHKIVIALVDPFYHELPSFDHLNSHDWVLYVG